MALNGQLPLSSLSAYPNYRPLPGQPVGPWAGNLRADAARALASASSHCQATLGLPVTLSEGYRDLDDQKLRWLTYNVVGHPLAARPGTSNHGGGIAADIREDAALSWLTRNGSRFGWLPTGMKFARPEPWHFDYVGGGDLEASPILRPSIPELMEEEMANPRLIQRNGKELAVVEIPGAGAKHIRDEAHYAEIRNFYNSMKIRLLSPTKGLIDWPDYKQLGGHYTRLSANGYDECMMFYKP